MSTARVTHEAEQVTRLIEQAHASAPAAQAGIEARARALGVPFTTDLVKLFAELGGVAAAAAARAKGHDQSLGATQLQHKGPAGARDDAVAALRDLLGSTKEALVARFGPAQVSAAFPAGRVPHHPAALSTHAAQVVKSLGVLPSSWSVVHALVQVDVPASIAALTAAQARVDAALEAVAAAGGAQVDVAAHRDDAQAQMHDLHKGLLDVLTGALEAAGEDQRANHMAIHRHLGRPKTAHPNEGLGTVAPKP